MHRQLTTHQDDKRVCWVAVAGNPNTGKTCVFNRLTGFRQRVGNYPGVTVEKKTGTLRGTHLPVRVLDLPGTYSLAARSPDEAIAADVLTGRQTDSPRPDIVLVVVDATNLERNLYLASQIMETGRPIVIALNMVDLAHAEGIHIDLRELNRQLGVPVVPTVAHRGRGMKRLCRAIERQLETPQHGRVLRWPKPFEQHLDALRAEAASSSQERIDPITRFELVRAILDEDGEAEQRLSGTDPEGAKARIAEARGDLDRAGIDLTTLESRVRYGWIHEVIAASVKIPTDGRTTWTDRIDAWATHRAWGPALFILLMGIVFTSVFSWAAPLSEGIEILLAWFGDWVGGVLPASAVQSLAVHGVIAGVGAVLVFLPQILILFLFISLMEDCGYMARAAFMVDRLMRLCNLSGRSFIPMLSCFACAVPAIMATRTIEDRQDRLTTILVAPLLSCSARIPIYVIMIAAFVPPVRVWGWLPLQGLIFTAMYLLGIVVAGVAAWILRRTLLKGGSSAFVMELPSYKVPSPATVLYRMYERGREFVLRAGTIIFAVTVLVWIASYYPRPADLPERVEASAGSEIEADQLERSVAAAYLQQSWLGRAGQLIEPAVRPLGWDWKIGVATLASFPAREVVIATLGTIYGLEDAGEDSLRERLRTAKRADGRPAFSLPVALSVMVFFALCCQCGGTLAVIRRETNSWRWPMFVLGYMTVLAYLGALITYQVARLIV
jgi:ferrous iron transport protein B